jgi:hypothetical protein
VSLEIRTKADQLNDLTGGLLDLRRNSALNLEKKLSAWALS